MCKNSDVLLAHARLHVFAKKIGFNSLSRLSLWKLVDALEPVVFNPYQTEGIFELLRFVGEPGAADEDLITLMIHYASSRLKSLVILCAVPALPL